MDSTPRISGELIISSFVGRNVIVVGKVLQLLGDSAIIARTAGWIWAMC